VLTSHYILHFNIKNTNFYLPSITWFSEENIIIKKNVTPATRINDGSSREKKRLRADQNSLQQVNSLVPNKEEAKYQNFFIAPVQPCSFFMDQSYKLGTGITSCVYRGTYYNEDVAIKLFESSYDKNAFMDEVGMLYNIQHPRCTAIKGYSMEPPVIIFKLYTMNLYELLKVTTLDRKFKINICNDIIYGMSYLHNCGFIHRDLKPQNILIDEKLRADISDFGTLTPILREDNRLVGTVYYIANEVFTKREYSIYSDYYSLGIIMWEIFETQKPYNHINELNGKSVYQIMEYIHSNNLRPLFNQLKLDDEIRNIIEMLWHQDISKRKEISSTLQLNMQMAAMCLDLPEIVMKSNYEDIDYS